MPGRLRELDTTLAGRGFKVIVDADRWCLTVVNTRRAGRSRLVIGRRWSPGSQAYERHRSLADTHTAQVALGVEATSEGCAVIWSPWCPMSALRGRAKHQVAETAHDLGGEQA